MPAPSVPSAEAARPPIVVRRATETDAVQLAALLQQLAPKEPQPDSQRLAERLNKPATGRVVMVAECDGKLLGTCSIHLIEHLAHDFARSAIIEDVVVEAQTRGLGIGQALMAQAIKQAREWDCYKVALSSNQTREAAHRFYQNLGFTLHGYSLALPVKRT